MTYPPEGSEFWQILPCIALTVRDGKRSSATPNKNSTRAFQRAINRGSTPPPKLPQNGDKLPKFVVFWSILTTKDEKSAAKFHYTKTVSDKVVAQSIALSGINILAALFPWYLNAKGPTPIASTCVAHTSPQRSSRDVIASLASVRLTAWPVAWNWRRAVLSADAGFLVDWHYYHKRQSRP